MPTPAMASDLNPTVLVIDDSDIARARMEAVLEDAGIHVLSLASPIGATRTIMVNSVDVVVIDVLMPAMRGDRLAALFRRNPRFKGLGVVLVSGAAPEELERLSLEVEADATVSKSQLDKLADTVLAIYQKRTGTNA